MFANYNDARIITFGKKTMWNLMRHILLAVGILEFKGLSQGPQECITLVIQL